MTAIYCRLSRDDGFANGDSCSIAVQKEMLIRYAEDNNLTPYKIWIDDGYTGTTLERPAFQDMLSEIERGNVDVCLCKDTSRLGRNYLAVGLFLENLTRHGVRLIAVSDGVDTASGEDEFMPFRTILHEFYAKDISKKIRASVKTRALRGEPTNGITPYGYIKDGKNWTIDENKAEVVRKIYSLFLGGMNFIDIAKELERLEIPTPSGKHNWWNEVTVATIIDNKEYTGVLITLRTGTMSFKDRRQISHPENEWVVTPNHHEPIIDIDFWENVHRIREQGRKRHPKNIERPAITGYLVCADCGHRLNFKRGNGANMKQHYYCPHYANRRYKPATCTMHYTRRDEIENVILTELQKILSFAAERKDEFVKLIQKNVKSTENVNRKTLLSDKTSSLKRISDINDIINNLYEDKVNKLITAERFADMLQRFEDEQLELRQKQIDIDRELAKEPVSVVNPQAFIRAVENIVTPNELTPELLSTFIRQVRVGQKKDGKQDIIIEWNMIGEVNGV
jgi:DNA invertase Pin-like site-specific DNA recombinase